MRTTGSDIRAPQASPADQLIRALTERAVYGHPTTTVTVLQTHISWVILTGPYAYKIKKPVNFGFVDFSTLAKRQHFCQEELRLNRRLAPQLYVAVVPISGTPEHPRLHDASAPIEYAVQMRQFPQEHLLSQLVAKGQLQVAHIDGLIQEVSAFHGRIAVAERQSPFGTPEAVYQPVQDNFQHLFDAVDDPLRQAHTRELEAWCQRSFRAQYATFVARKRDGFVRECHGDLHLGNMVLLDDAVVIFDGLEFNDHLRWIDVASDVAFLAMDLADRGRSDLAHRFVNGYVEQTGDYGLLALLPFYSAYRAMVRAKVAGLRLGQGDLSVSEATQARETFGSYLDLATQYTRPVQPQLLITHGVSGSGKTYGTQPLVDTAGAIRLRADVERKRLFGLAALERSADHRALELYTDDATQRTYAHLLQQAERVVRAGYTAIVDATFLRQAQREAFRHLAAQLGVPFTILDFCARLETSQNRIVQRLQRADDASEADLTVLQRQLATREPLTVAEQPYGLAIDTDAPHALDRLLEALYTTGARAVPC
ncbi:MAG: aminoglycoside phosphotransferase [Candidatus Tectomicrobia bacterium]|uniref:Aminoglycoside phosphotransferase n=1 Tax=Tectimicrobiota bacterium TaxID=2528274 RepID=A0A937W8C7_UNCTE|nr:aminoglycoside phosphotransferase [Candidatus Tectomicrobia bacterium]